FEPMAGLADIARGLGKSEEALDYAEKILTAIEAGPLEGPDRGLWIHLVCYQVLAQTGDHRAPAVIKRAHQLLSHRAEAISNHKFRQSYLSGVSEHREICNIWKSLLKNN
ncbi:MAG: hypothetical protein SVR81_09160, partial [Chloroflexota bacterium]|nr:hypothetical protein [Chloroflexota bacterium]